jgi:hypothetical protein
LLLGALVLARPSGMSAVTNGFVRKSQGRLKDFGRATELGPIPTRRIWGVAMGNKHDAVATVRRQFGRINIGLYCQDCFEFFSIVVLPVSATEAMGRTHTAVRVSDGPLCCRCPLCGYDQEREVAEITSLRLSDENHRLRAPPRKPR